MGCDGIRWGGCVDVFSLGQSVVEPKLWLPARSTPSQMCGHARTGVKYVPCRFGREVMRLLEYWRVLRNRVGGIFTRKRCKAGVGWDMVRGCGILGSGFYSS